MEFEPDSPRPPLDERMAVFVGSAVSLFEPTSLPTWTDFVRGVVGGLVTCALQGRRDQELTQRLMGSKPYVILDTIIRRLGSKYLHVMRGLDHRPHNKVHEYLAEGLLSGRFPTIVTTNFDRCLENLLERKGVVLCELHGQDEEADVEALDRQANLKQPMNIVVCTSPLAFTLLKKTPSLLGRRNYGFILKVHGDCRYEETCVDTEAQRARGLPAQVLGVLSLILQRFPMFFIGWSGADLDENEDYVRLKSEHDLARIYWLLRPGEAEPSAFARLKKPLGDRFTIVRGQLLGKISATSASSGSVPLPGSFEASCEEWARKHIGSKWARVVLADLALETKHFMDVERFLNIDAESAELDPELSVRSSITKTQVKFLPFTTSQNTFGRRHAKLVLRVLSSLDFLAQGKLDKAWRMARRAAIESVPTLLHGGLRFSDSWVPFALCALVLAHDPKHKELAELCFIDAEAASIESGNHRAKRELGNFYSLFAMATPIVPDLDPKNDPRFEDDPIDVFNLSFDNAARVTTGVPDSILMRAELYRAAICGNSVAIPSQFLVDSRPFVTEVIFSIKDDATLADMLSLIKPILFDEVGVKKVNLKEDPHPIITSRMEGYVNNPNLIYEEIPDEMIQQMDAYYASRRHAIGFFDAKQVANAYKQRTLALLDDINSIDRHFKTHRAAADAKLVFPIISEFAKVTAPGESVLYRSLLYKFGDLFVKATSEEDLWSGFYPNVREAVEAFYGSKEEFLRKRRIITDKAFRLCSIVKEASDAAYITNLPLHKLLCFAADEQDIRSLQLVATALRHESDGPKLDDSTIKVGQFDALQLASLPMARLKEIRQSKEALAFRTAVRKARAATSDEDYHRLRQECTDTAQALFKLAKTFVLRPGQRPLPKTLSSKSCEGMDPRFDEFRKCILHGLRPSLSPPPMPLFEIPMLDFPALVITRPGKTSA